MRKVTFLQVSEAYAQRGGQDGGALAPEGP